MRELQAFVQQKLSVWEVQMVTWPATLDNFNNTFSVQPQLKFWWYGRLTLSPFSLGNPDNLGWLPWVCSQIVPAIQKACPWEQDLLQLKQSPILWFSVCWSVSHILWPEGAEKAGSNVHAMQWLQGISPSSLWVKGCLGWGKSLRSC